MTLSAKIWRWYRLEIADWLLWFRLPNRTRDLYHQVLADHPNDAHTLSCLAFLEAGRGERDAAIAHFTKVTHIEPEKQVAHYNLGFLLQESKQHEAAVSAFDRVIALNPKHDLAHYGKALSLISLEKLEEAVPHLKQATELQPMSPFSWYQLARIHHQAGATDKAAKIIRHLKSFEPKFADQLIRETGIRVEAT